MRGKIKIYELFWSREIVISIRKFFVLRGRVESSFLVAFFWLIFLDILSFSLYICKFGVLILRLLGV